MCVRFNSNTFRECALVFALFCVVASQAHLVISEHEQFRARPPPIVASRLEQRSPSEVMVDLSNDLAYKLMHLHSILNRNNFAFSPAALMCVLVAVYEGSAGRSSLELRNALMLPNNRDIVRVGYRDIHRRLRTYFFDDDENPLKGLSLNKENVTITAEYETILKFYGYDLGMDMVSSTTAPTMMSTTEEVTTTTTTSSTMKEMEKTTPMEPMVTTSSQQTTTVETTTTAPEATTTPEPPQTMSTTTESPDDDRTTTMNPSESDETVTEASPQEMKANFRRYKSSGKLVSPPSLEYLPAKFTKIRSSSMRRSRRHLFGLKNIDASLYYDFLPPQPEFLPATQPQDTITIEAVPPPPLQLAKFSSVEVIAPIAPFEDGIPGLPIKSAFQLDVEQGFVPHLKQGLNSEVVDHIFYLNDQEIIHTTFKVYNSVLYYKYFEHLKMSILELELDSTDYNLMIFLPDVDIDLLTATSTLRLGPTLRTLRKQLKPRWVQAIIPDFKLHGNMFLTNDLQNLGICDIFEPNRADFRPMTDESGIYVKHIEQAINVNIRTRPINHLKRSYGPQTRPIQVSVNHPFMFFIIDRDLDVATMAGRVLNPLNVRIQ